MDEIDWARRGRWGWRYLGALGVLAAVCVAIATLAWPYDKGIATSVISTSGAVIVCAGFPILGGLGSLMVGSAAACAPVRKIWPLVGAAAGAAGLAGFALFMLAMNAYMFGDLLGAAVGGLAVALPPLLAGLAAHFVGARLDKERPKDPDVKPQRAGPALVLGATALVGVAVLFAETLLAEPSSGGASLRLYESVDFLDYPSPGQVLARYPARARQERVAGSAKLDCWADSDSYLGDCAIVSEGPEGYGFGAAAIDLAQETIRPRAFSRRVAFDVVFSLPERPETLVAAREQQPQQPAAQRNAQAGRDEDARRVAALIAEQRAAQQRAEREYAAAQAQARAAEQQAQAQAQEVAYQARLRASNMRDGCYSRGESCQSRCNSMGMASAFGGNANAASNARACFNSCRSEQQSCLAAADSEEQYGHTGASRGYAQQSSQSSSQARAQASIACSQSGIQCLRACSPSDVRCTSSCNSQAASCRMRADGGDTNAAASFRQPQPSAAPRAPAQGGYRDTGATDVCIPEPLIIMTVNGRPFCQAYICPGGSLGVRVDRPCPPSGPSEDATAQ